MRFTADEIEEIRASAAAEGKTVSEWSRGRLLVRRGAKPPDAEEDT